jgi:hypothetical protein
MESEYNNNTDEFSKSLSGVTVTKFNAFLNTCFETGETTAKGLQTVNHIASELNLSPKYLSDLLKQETDKTALEMMHLHVVSEAKRLKVSMIESICLTVTGAVRLAPVSFARRP